MAAVGAFSLWGVHHQTESLSTFTGMCIAT